MSMSFKRIKDWATRITAFRTGDVIPVDGPSGTAKMSKDTLLELTAQNAFGSIKNLATTKYTGFMALDGYTGVGKMPVSIIFNNFAEKFVPSTEPNPTTTVAGRPYIYDGLLYIAKEAYQGPWDAGKFEATNISAFVERETIEAKKYLDSDLVENSGFFEYINRSLNINSGEIGNTDRTNRVCTPSFYQITDTISFVLRAETGFSFQVFTYTTNEPLVWIDHTGWVKEITSSELSEIFVGSVLFRIVVKADDESDIDASTFSGIKYYCDMVKFLGTNSEFATKEIACNGCGFANISLKLSYGTEVRNRPKRLTSPMISTSVLAAVSLPSNGMEYTAFLYDNRRNFLGMTEWFNRRKDIDQLKIDYPKARYIRLCFKKVVGGVDVDISPDTDGKNIKVTNRMLNFTRIPFERGSISESDGKFVDSSTTDDADNASGFYGHWRMGKLIKTNSKSALFVFDDSLVTNMKLYEFDSFFGLKSIKSVAALTSLALETDTRYIRIACESTNNPSVDIVLSDSQVDFIYNTDEEYQEHSYIYEVAGNCGCDVYEDDTTITQYANGNYFYNSLTFKLPPNYSPVGKPVPVIFFCHGSGNMNARTSTSMGYKSCLDYLNSEGYAVLDCFSTSSKYANTGRALHNSNLDDMACIASAIKWFTDNYNVEKDVYFMCKSRGGNAALAACYQSAYKVKACGLLAPSISIFSGNRIFAYDPQGRMNFANDMGFENVGDIDVTSLNYPKDGYPTADAIAYVKGNWKKLIGVCSTFLGFPGSTTEEMVDHLAEYDYDDPIFETTPKDLPVPTKIWIAIDDANVSYSEVLKWQKCVQLGHGMAVVRTLPSNTGGHHAVDTDANALKVASITTKQGIVCTNVPLAYVELVRWFRQFE